MKNLTKVKVPKKHQHKIELLEKDSDGYWAYLKPGFISDMETHMVHEDTVKELMEGIRGIEECDCEDCQKGFTW